MTDSTNTSIGADDAAGSPSAASRETVEAGARAAAGAPALKGAPAAGVQESKPRVVVLAGGLSHERDVSIRSGRRVAEALRSVGMEVALHDVDAGLLTFLTDTQPDVVWPLLHGAGGEDGSLRDVLELLDIPYVGTGPRASRVAWDKTVAKNIVQHAGLATPAHACLPHALFRELGARAVLATLVKRLGLPLVVKPTQGGSALGVSIVTSADELPRAMVDCYAYGDVALIESAVAGTELAISVIDDGSGPRALPPVEIVSNGVYDYDARYNAGRTQYFTPARISAEANERVIEVALSAHTALGLRHLSRTDVILDGDGEVQFLEVNVAPGLTETSLFPQAALAAGLDLPQLYADIVRSAVRR